MRLFAVLGFSYLFAITAALFCGCDISLFLAIGFFVLFLVALAVPAVRKGAIFPLIFISCSVGFISFWSYDTSVTAPAKAYNDSEAHISAVLCELPYESYGRFYYTLSITEIDGRQTANSFKALAVSSVEYDIEPYDTVTADVLFYQNDDTLYRNYDISKGIMLRAVIDDACDVNVTKAEQRPLYYYALMARSSIEEFFNDNLSQTQAAMVSAIVLGDKHSLTDEQRQNFSNAGVSHVMSVSGFHVSVISQIFVLLFTLILRRKRAASLCAVVFILAFMAVTGFPVSVVRAGIMQIIYLLGIVAFKEADALNSLGFATLFICVLNPYAGGDFGFLLSFSATLGIILLSDRITLLITERIFTTKPKKCRLREKLKKPIKAVVSLVSVTVSSTVFSLPVLLMVFRQFPLYSILSNMLISLPTSIMLVLSVFAVIFNYTVVLSFLSKAMMYLCGLLADYISYCVELISNLPFSVINTSYAFVPVWLVVTVLMFLSCLLLKNRRRTVFASTLISLLSLFLMMFVYSATSADTSMYIADCKNGINFSVKTESGLCVVSYGGSKAYDMFTYLDTMTDKSIDLLISGGSSAKYIINSEYILENYDVSSVAADNSLSLSNELNNIQNSEANIISLNRNEITALHTGDITYHALNTKSGNFVYFHLNKNTDVLVCPQYGSISDIPSDWKSPTVCIMSDIPKDYEQLSTSFIVLSCSKQNITKLYLKANKICGNIYATAAGGNIRLEAPSSDRLLIWSEDQWLS